MLKRKIVIAVSALAMTMTVSSVARAQSKTTFYGSPPCGFIEIPDSKSPGPVWRIDFRKWESAACIENRGIYEFELDSKQAEQKKRQQQIRDELAAAEQIRGRMEAERLSAEVSHTKVIDALLEAERLYMTEMDRPNVDRDWGSYKTQLRTVDKVRSNYSEHNSAYISLRGEYEKNLASLKALQIVEAAS